MKQWQNLGLTIFVITTLFVGLFGTISYANSQWDMTGISLEGTPLEQSTFSNRSSTENQGYYPNSYKVVTSRPYVIERDYAEYIPRIEINLSEALDIALEWLQRVGPPFVEWNLFTYSNSTSPPSWTLRFSHPDFSAYVIVDSIFGLIIEYESKYLHEYDPTPISLSEAEEFVHKFLKEEQIQLPSNSFYIRGQPYDCQRFYTLVFQEYVGPIKIEGSIVEIRASAFTRSISYYINHWIGINDIQTQGVVSLNYVKQSAVEQLGFFVNLDNLYWFEPELSLANYHSNDTDQYRLAWTISLSGEQQDNLFEATIFSDAYSGNVFAYRTSEESLHIIENESFRITPEISMIIGMSSFLFGLFGILVLYRGFSKK